jgi:MoxR-like ATPase
MPLDNKYIKHPAKNDGIANSVAGIQTSKIASTSSLKSRLLSIFLRLDKKLNQVMSQPITKTHLDIGGPLELNELDKHIKPRHGEETSEEFFYEILDSIERGDHMLLIGPRGCGKSYAVRRAINMGEQPTNGNKDQSILVPGAQIMAQGNKEFPRDYFFEPEIEYVSISNGKKQEISVRLRQPPLFVCAKLEEDTGGLHLDQVNSQESEQKDLITRYRATFEKDGRKIEKFVLFLDEINRFNDGVLDSLLLLLEDKCVSYQGKTVEVPVVVIATMNPPGYDVSARSLSPPLMSRFSSVVHLYTAGLATLVNTILPSELKLTSKENKSIPIHFFAAASLAFWGAYDKSRPCAAYLSPITCQLLQALYTAGDDQFRQDLDFIQSVSDYGPDARAARDWIFAARREVNKNKLSVVSAAIKTLAESVSNKLVLNFSPEAKPEKLNQLIEALGRVTYSIFSQGDDDDSNSLHTVIVQFAAES